MIDWRDQIDKDTYQKQLVEIINDPKKTVSVFIGAGISAHAGIPLGNGLIKILYEAAKNHRNGEIEELSGRWKQDASICKNALGEPGYHQLLIDTF